MSKFMSLIRGEEGIQHAEEALLLSLVAVVSIVAVRALGVTIDGVFGDVNDGFTAP